MRKIFVTIIAGMLLSSPVWGAGKIRLPEPGSKMPKLEMKDVSSSSRLHAPKGLQKSKEIQEAKPDLYSGRVIDAAMIANNSWSGMDMFQIPYGLYKMDMGSGQATQVMTDALKYDFYAGAYSETEFVGVRIMSMMGMFNGLAFISLDPQTKKENWYVQDGDASFADLPCAMAYNPVDDKFYSVNYNESMTGLTLATLDTEKHKFMSYEGWKAQFQPLTMAFSPKGVCYVIGGDGVLYTVNMENGTVKEVGSTGVTPTLYVQAMTFDGTTGNFIWAAETNRGSRVYAVDPTTAETEEITMLADNQQFVGLHLPLNSAYYGAPAQVQTISFSSSNGALEGKVNFSLPNTTFAGASMSGDLKYTVWIDGEILVENAKGTTGQYVSLPATVTEGNHVFAVMTSNNIGDSPLKASTYWAGFDYPAAPAYVNLSAEDGNFKISWASVYEGQHKGYMYWQPTYNVYRMPDNVLVATKITTTSYTDPIPSEMKRYYYEVAAVNSDGKEGARTASPEILQGNALVVPYFEGFDDDSYKGIWRFEDRTGNNRSWRLQPGEIIADMFQGKNDMWAVVPPVSLEAGYKYQLTLNIRQAFAFSDDNVTLYIGKKDDSLDKFTKIAEFNKDLLPDDFDDITADFFVNEAGAYEFGICVWSNDNGGVVRINSVSVDKLGKLGAPEAATDIVITPDANDALEATVTFKAPSVTLENKTLSSISYFKILVDGVEAATVNNVKPGANVSQKVTGIKGVGKHIFTLAGYNGEGMGKTATASQFIGCYTAPFSESFDDTESLEFWTGKYNFDTSNLFSPPMHYSSYDKSLEVSWFAKGADEKTWVFSPDFKLDPESVYILSIDFNHQHYGEGAPYRLNVGKGTDPESQKLLKELPTTEAYYKFVPVTAEVVITEGGKYNFGFYSSSTAANDYPSYKIDNLALTYLTSAKAPYSITDFKGVADVTGKLEADLSFNAPLVDFANRKLTKIDKIEIIRGTNVVETFNNPTPGAALKWHDSNANYGKNAYSVVAYNSDGRGKVYEVNLFVGEDIPAVENVTLIGNEDNMSATLSWDRTEFGVNGGVLMDSDMKYHVFEYDPNTEGVKILETITGTSYNLPKVSDNTQTYYFYGVIPVNDINQGTPVILSVQLGKLYNMPFAESFPSGLPQTSLWSIYSQNPYISWQLMNGFWDGYSAQDNDGGCIGFFNGNAYTNYAGDRLYSPKFKIGKDGHAELKFYVLHVREEGSENYPYPALMRVGVSADDSEFQIITKDEDMEFDGSNKKWKEFTIDLTPYVGTKHMRICFDAYTNGGHEVIYLDNISIKGEESGVRNLFDNSTTPAVSGALGSIMVRNAEGLKVMVYSPSGLVLGSFNGESMMNIPFAKGIYIVKIADRTFKVQVR